MSGVPGVVPDWNYLVKLGTVVTLGLGSILCLIVLL